MQELKAGALLAAVLVGLLLIGLAQERPALEVTHVYEDGCADVYDNDLKRYKFYCEEEF